MVRFIRHEHLMDPDTTDADRILEQSRGYRRGRRRPAEKARLLLVKNWEQMGFKQIRTTGTGYRDQAAIPD